MHDFDTYRSKHLHFEHLDGPKTNVQRLTFAVQSSSQSLNVTKFSSQYLNFVLNLLSKFQKHDENKVFPKLLKFAV